MKSILLSFILFCEFTGSTLAVQSIDQPFSKLKLTDGRVLENARLKAFNSDSVFVRDDDGFVQVPYKLFPPELQPQLAKARAAAAAPAGPAPDHGSMAPSRPVAARPAARVGRPFSYEPLGAANGGFLELVCFYDRVHELFGPETWVRVLQWGATGDDGALAGRSIVVFELKEQLRRRNPGRTLPRSWRLSPRNTRALWRGLHITDMTKPHSSPSRIFPR
jgi:hypothetical protein